MELSDCIAKLQKPLALSCLTASSSWVTSSGWKSGSSGCCGEGSTHNLATPPDPLAGLSWPRPSLDSMRNCWELCWRRESVGIENETVVAMSCLWMVLRDSVLVKTEAWLLSWSAPACDRLVGNGLFGLRCPAAKSVLCWAGQRPGVCGEHKVKT